MNKTIEERLEALEKALPQGELVLVDKNNPSVAISLSVVDRRLITTVSETTVTTKQLELFNINTQNDEE